MRDEVKGEFFFAKEPFCLYFYCPFGNQFNKIDCERCIHTCYVGTSGLALKYFFHVLVSHCLNYPGSWMTPFKKPKKLPQILFSVTLFFLQFHYLFVTVPWKLFAQAFKFCFKIWILCWYGTPKAEWGVF